jgi:hypothetical protein
MINPDDEDALRLGVFAASLLVIAHRERTNLACMAPTPELSFAGTSVPTNCAVAEARAIADAVVEEARRLHTGSKRP